MRNILSKTLAQSKDPGPREKDSNSTFISITAFLEECSQLSFSDKEGEYFNTFYALPGEMHNVKKISKWFFLSRRQ